ncbi:MAG TPA: hypothetical protein DCL54_06630, partial [Alphaproteobacteria bacterium]|nr:hypothetical protein [Alphaproteobacteria bacterium]
LFDLAHGRPGALWDALQSRAGETHFAQAHARLMAVLTRADTLPPFEFFAQELGPRGARTRLLERLGPDANDPIDEFLNLALAFEQAHAPSLQSFLHWVMQGAAEIKRDLDKGAGVVRIMTIHGAKGLEGNIVILPDTGQTPPNRRAVLLKEDDGVFLWSINAKRDCLRREALVTAANDRERQEYHRLLYVALTRASEQLIVCGFKNARGQGYENSWHDLVTRAARGLPMQEIEAEHGTKLVYVKPQEKPVAAISGVMAERAAALPHWAQVQLHTLKRIPRTRPAASGGTQSTAARYGELVHLCLRRAEQPRQDWAALATQFQLSADEVALALAEAARIRAEPALAHVFVSATRAEVAFDVLDEAAGARITGRFDRLAVTPEAATIFEFKTARNPPAAPGDVPDIIRRQLGLYARAATLIFPGRAVSAELIWTAKAHRMCLPSPLLEQWGRGP